MQCSLMTLNLRLERSLATAALVCQILENVAKRHKAFFSVFFFFILAKVEKLFSQVSGLGNILFNDSWSLMLHAGFQFKEMYSAKWILTTLKGFYLEAQTT